MGLIYINIGGSIKGSSYKRVLTKMGSKRYLTEVIIGQKYGLTPGIRSDSYELDALVLYLNICLVGCQYANCSEGRYIKLVAP